MNSPERPPCRHDLSCGGGGRVPCRAVPWLCPWGEVPSVPVLLHGRSEDDAGQRTGEGT